MKLSMLFSMIMLSIVTLARAFATIDPTLATSTAMTTSTSTSMKVLRRYAKAAQWFPATYSHCLTHHHLATECVTAGCMAGLGDYLAQRKSQKGWNPKRSFHFVLKGLGEGIMWSIWYHKADLWVESMTLSALWSGWMVPTMVAVFKTIVSLLLDLCIACPLIYGLWDIPLPALLSGTPWRDVPRQVKSKLGEMMIASIKLWTPVNILIYNSPLRYRVLLMATADVFWQSIVSAIATRELDVLNSEDIVEQGISLIPPASNATLSRPTTHARSHSVSAVL